LAVEWVWGLWLGVVFPSGKRQDRGTRSWRGSGSGLVAVWLVLLGAEVRWQRRAGPNGDPHRCTGAWFFGAPSGIRSGGGGMAPGPGVLVRGYGPGVGWATRGPNVIVAPEKGRAGKCLAFLCLTGPRSGSGAARSWSQMVTWRDLVVVRDEDKCARS